jgi:hypothetical protein
MPSPIQIDDELYARVAAAAAHEGKDASTYVAELVREALRRRFAAVLSADTEDLEENYTLPPFSLENYGLQRDPDESDEDYAFRRSLFEGGADKA